jgi:Flp pilus assembly protein TadD
LIALNPDYAIAHTWYAVSLVAVGRNAEAVQQIERARDLDPLSLITNTEVGRVFYLARNCDDAVLELRKVIDLEPRFARARTRLGMTCAAQQKYREAIDQLLQAQQLAGADPYLDGLLGYAYAKSGNAQEANSLLEKLSVFPAARSSSQ